MSKTFPINLKKRWIIIIVIFLMAQLILITVDGTFLEPNVNDKGSLAFRTVRWILDSRLFTKWITFYSFPFFNMLLLIHVIAVLFQAIQDSLLWILSKK